MVSFRRVSSDDINLNASIDILNKRVFPYTTSTSDLHWLASHFEGAPAELIAIEEDGDFKGYAYIIHFFQASFVSLLAIVPEYHDRGYGTKLLEHLRKMQGDRPIVLTAFALHSGKESLDTCARRRWFYIKNGYIDQHIPFPSEDDYNSDVYVNGSNLGYIELLATLDKVNVFFNSLHLHHLGIE